MMFFNFHRRNDKLILTLLMAALIAVTKATPPSSSSSSSSSSSMMRGQKNLPYLREEDLSKYAGSSLGKNEWMSTSKDVQFMPVMNVPPRMRNLEDAEEEEQTTGSWEQFDPYSVQPFVEGMSEYDEYQQAWRMLGFMVDCNFVEDDEDGSGSEDTTEEGCARYVVWAAYVDLDYEGGGIAEYQYWDRDTQSWDDSACAYADGGSGDDEYGNSRCAKMDCHLDDTSFAVLGFFKHRSYDDWMEQLFKHEGICVWTDEEYAFMKNARKSWPRGCVDSGKMSDDGQYNLYYNIKPSTNGRISIGFYTDTKCVEEFSVTTEQTENIIGNFFFESDNGSGDNNDNGDYDFSSESLSESMDRWNSAFAVWTTCHPCVAYDIENTDGSGYGDDDCYDGDDDGGGNRRQRNLGGESCPTGEKFECYDDAGYTNVNQCMKFSAKTVMKTATFRDLSLGRTQQTFVEYPLSGFLAEASQFTYDAMSNFATYFWFIAVTMAFCLSLFCLCKVSRYTTKSKGANQESLLSM